MGSFSWPWEDYKVSGAYLKKTALALQLICLGFKVNPTPFKMYSSLQHGVEAFNHHTKRQEGGSQNSDFIVTLSQKIHPSHTEQSI